MVIVSYVNGFELALQSHCCVVVLDELVKLVAIAYVELAEAENPFIYVD